MKEQKWDDALDNVKETFESPTSFAEDGIELKIVQRKPKSQLTELRRRIEERLETKRIALEYEDFECFSKSNSDVKTFFCNITHARWKKNGNKLVFTITANRFLRNMVRAIVGTLIEIGLGKKNINQIHHIIKSKSRSLAGYSVPAKGLFLTHIDYPDSIYIEHGKG